MKRLALLSAVLVVLGVFQAYGQIRFGVKGGLNWANTDVTNINTDSKTGFHGGLFLGAKMTKVAVIADFLYSIRGWGGIGASDLSYVDIPVMLKIYLVRGLHLELGPQFGVLLIAEDLDGVDIKDKLEASEISGAFGLGFDLPMGLGFGVRYIIGFTDVNKDFEINIGEIPEIKNQMLQISVWYALKK